MSSKGTTSQQIQDAMRDLRDRGRVCTRQVLSEMLGLKLSIVDDHIKRMKDAGDVRMVVNGVFELVEKTPPDRAVSATYLPDGRVKVEVGDDLLNLSLREAQALGMAVGGVFLQFARFK
jgi:DNA-binding MarR family transcriptional regulator